MKYTISHLVRHQEFGTGGLPRTYSNKKKEQTGCYTSLCGHCTPGSHAPGWWIIQNCARSLNRKTNLPAIIHGIIRGELKFFTFQLGLVLFYLLMLNCRAFLFTVYYYLFYDGNDAEKGGDWGTQPTTFSVPFFIHHHHTNDKKTLWQLKWEGKRAAD